jgi:DNA polymerase I
VRGGNPGIKVVRNMVTSRWVPWDLPDDEWNPLIHGTLIMCDFSQIEMRLLAHFAAEEAMIAAFRGDDDFFVALARQIFQDPTITKKDPRRQITKNSGYAKIYGAGVRKFAQTAGISDAQARDFLARFDALYPGVKRFQFETLDAAMRLKASEGFASTRSPFTNRRFVADDRKEYTLVNYKIQGSAAEILKQKMLELSAAGLGEWMFLPVHDEVLLDVPGEHVRDVVRTLQQVMNDDELLSVPIQAEISYGRRWGSKVDWNPAL